ncbi:MAG: hypothetical protein LBR53_13650, partial [Deltaproteobacteria bacterium]|nr:hypothetical protein [Deltaproteobacteria bacterium]
MVVNREATIGFEYVEGSGYADIVVEYKKGKYLIEMRLKDDTRSMANGMAKLLSRVDDLLVKEGWLVVADLKSQKSGKGEITWETRGTPED